MATSGRHGAVGRRWRIGCVVVAIALAVGAVAALWQVKLFIDIVKESEHCLAVCFHLQSSAYEMAGAEGLTGVTPETLRAALPWGGEGPRFWKGDDGTADLWGNPLTVRVEEGEGVLRATVLSAGRDGKPSTPDDISASEEWPWPPPAQDRPAEGGRDP